VIFFFSFAFNNSSMYDPYWSVAPLPIALFWAFHNPEGLTVRSQLAVLLIIIWGVRLTYNWHRQWRGLGHEDWRYVDFRGRAGRRYWLVSLFGIHLFPTLMVFLGCLAIYPVMIMGSSDPGILDGVAVVITSGAILIEGTADSQLRAFTASKPPREAIMSSGLWAYSRHPNYFGEVSFWWGLFVFSIAADPSYWWTIAGPISITIMFLTVSIPMMEKRMLARRPGFAERQRTVPALAPWLRKVRGVKDLTGK
jgi:steroid 5-alpha reductase family enzyme